MTENVYILAFPVRAALITFLTLLAKNGVRDLQLSTK